MLGGTQTVHHQVSDGGKITDTSSYRVQKAYDLKIDLEKMNEKFGRTFSQNWVSEITRSSTPSICTPEARRCRESVITSSRLREFVMRVPTWVSPGLYGAACGAVALAIVGFGWGGWVTSGKAEQMALTASQTAVVTVLTPLCLDMASRDPDFAAKLVELKKASSYSRGEMVIKAGWGTLPGTAEANRDVARACASKLVL
jgi:hypothetical protein